MREGKGHRGRGAWSEEGVVGGTLASFLCGAGKRGHFLRVEREKAEGVSTPSGGFCGLRKVEEV